MFNLANIICVKLRSNSGRKLQDNQLQYIAQQNNIPLTFLEDMRKENYHKVFFEKKIESTNTTVTLIAYADSSNLHLTEKFKKIPEILKAQISIIETVKIPKETVRVVQNQNKSKDKLPTKKSRPKKNIKNRESDKTKKNIPDNNRKFEGDINNILKINLDDTVENLKTFCEDLGLDYGVLLEESKTFSVLYYLLLGDGGCIFIAYSRRNNSKIEMMSSFIEILKKMKFTDISKLGQIFEDNMLQSSSTSSKNQKTTATTYDIDSILDKIHTVGLENITEAERTYLESYAEKPKISLMFQNARNRKSTEVKENDETMNHWAPLIKPNKEWRLPQIDELEAMYHQLHKKGIGNFKNEIYWSATKFSADAAWYYDFNKGVDGTMSIKLSANARLIK